MQALVARRIARGVELRPASTVEPARGRDDEVLVAVELAAIEAGALDPRDARVDGRIVGCGFVGHVLAPAADGSGPALGARVVGLVAGAARERLAVSAATLALVPDVLESVEAALLPVPGLGAHRALERVGFAFGKRLAVLGAASATGQLACQLGLGSGMRVTGLVEGSEHERAVRSHGVERVVPWSASGTGGASASAPAHAFDLVIDASAGRCPPCATIALASDGACIGLSVDELGETPPCAALPSVAHDDPRAHVRGVFDRTGVDPEGVVLARLIDSLATGDIVLPLPADPPGDEIRVPRRAHLLPIGSGPVGAHPPVA